MKTKFLHERNFILEFLLTFEESYSFDNNFLKDIFSIENLVSFNFLTIPAQYTISIVI